MTDGRNRRAAEDSRHMARALELAREGWGRVHPNPLVGAVVVRGGEVVGEGAHREFGGAHAEVEALREAGPRARGATLYVTLEPCAHHGKTPPCTDAIRAAGVARLVFAVEDPDPKAAGGARQLAESGIEVVPGVERERARFQNALFLVPHETGRPFVALKYGLTLDARIAAAPGVATRVTGPESEAEVHRLRSGFDAVLVGGRTARIDDPRLTVRIGPPPRVPPVRVVADPEARLDPASRLAGSAAEAPVWVLAKPDAPEARVRGLEAVGVEVLRAGADPNAGLDPVAMLDILRDRGIRTVLCEGGGRLGAALLAADRVDRLYLFIAPNLFGAGGVPAFPGEIPLRGQVRDVRRLGDDVLVIVERSE